MLFIRDEATSPSAARRERRWARGRHPRRRQCFYAIAGKRRIWKMGRRPATMLCAIAFGSAPWDQKQRLEEGGGGSGFFFFCVSAFLHDTPSVFGYAVGRGLCLANSTATVLLRHRWDRRIGPSAVYRATMLCAIARLPRGPCFWIWIASRLVDVVSMTATRSEAGVSKCRSRSATSPTYTGAQLARIRIETFPRLLLAFVRMPPDHIISDHLSSTTSARRKRLPA
ncbi:hypothetical protein F5X68DRAFT_961 [Plectosphaerella plurivora]|uniref:Uncharacterized protein n=1 Tax=Plectosphaerella plurivora TaxID=936078 RepID=A0A9P9AG70_9PEZI|nr:hypothetical protein F5X68DRAFT_961 [Plectosphaerella plurivora]